MMGMPIQQGPVEVARVKGYTRGLGSGGVARPTLEGPGRHGTLARS